MAKSGQIVYVVRHGERVDNVDSSWKQQVVWGMERPYDPPLTERGKCQAAELGEQLKQENLHCVVSSPFFRCLQTAQQISNAAVSSATIGVCNRLCEFLHPTCGIQVPPALPTADLPSHGIDLADKYWPKPIVLVTHGYSVTETFRWACPERSQDVWGCDYCAWVKLTRPSKRGNFSVLGSNGVRFW